MCDSNLWGFLKNRVIRSNPDTMNELEDNIRTEITGITQQEFLRVNANFITRCQVRMNQDGHQFEQLLQHRIVELPKLWNEVRWSGIRKNGSNITNTSRRNCYECDIGPCPLQIHATSCNEFQSLGRAIVKEDEYEEVRWDGIVSIVSRRERVFRLWWEESMLRTTFSLIVLSLSIMKPSRDVKTELAPRFKKVIRIGSQTFSDVTCKDKLFAS
ncbi:hypothetical protein ANN_23820 [Periplaneta americana]|uniref:Uncharacterized protein n=1 Tax=Periplaneta americana TaxID=6978 RepID=A0ABQ8SNG8_PERAM|nr:hypothetical protein ANN_23820 [Periplaneta americana]